MVDSEENFIEQLGSKLKLTKNFETRKKIRNFKFLSQKNRSQKCQTATEI